MRTPRRNLIRGCILIDGKANSRAPRYPEKSLIYQLTDEGLS
jgi:hypothetical protein